MEFERQEAWRDMQNIWIYTNIKHACVSIG